MALSCQTSISSCIISKGSADTWLIFTFARIPQGMQKYTEEKCLYCPSLFCFSTLHAGTGGIHKFLGFLNYVSFLKSHFELVVRLVRSEC